MKVNLIRIYQITLSLFFIIMISCNESEKITDTEEKTEISGGISTSTFKVWGNCGMCEDKIENSLKVDGVKDADWDSETKIMKVSYDSSIIDLDSIQRRIAAVGYDTQKYKSNDSTYSRLHECCQYERKK